MPYLANNQYRRMGAANRKTHQMLANRSCKLLTGRISPPTGGILCKGPLMVGLRSNVRNLCPWVFIIDLPNSRSVQHLRLGASLASRAVCVVTVDLGPSDGSI
jgi:hypothetical protein